MTLRVFITAGSSPSPGSELELDEDESRYLLKVRRARVGAPLELLDGRGGAWIGELVGGTRRARVAVAGPRARSAVSSTAKIVLLGLPDNAATLEAVTGASELGATELLFIRCERSQGRVPPRARLDRVVRAAMRQCGRAEPPSLVGAPPQRPASLSEALAHRPELPGLFGAPGAARASVALDQGVRLLVGPEGGLTPSEIEAAHAAGFVGAGLGPWILRTQTAVVAMLARYG